VLKAIADLPFSSVILCDTEYEFGVDADGNPVSGNMPRPVCICALDLKSGQRWTQFRGGFSSAAPFPIDDNSLFVAYSASAEMGTFLALGWGTPRRILDLYPEFYDLRNGRDGSAGRSLLDALLYFGLESIGAGHKKNMIARILAGPPYSETERQEISEYCMSDVDALARLLPAMLSNIDWKGALLRGRYGPAVASIERAGVPIDVVTNDRMLRLWTPIQAALIREIDQDYGVYDGTVFKEDKFESLVERLGLPWARLPSGKLRKDDDTFRDMARIFPVVSPLRELRHSIGKMRRADLAIGEDGRARTSLRPFSSKTSRNQPSSTTNIFGSSVWRRGLIKPPRGHALLYCDYSAEEFAVAAAISGDVAMMRDYAEGDPYVNFGIAVGMLPPRSTKASAAITHPGVRDQLKVACLAILYGMGPELLGPRMNRSKAVARALIEAHKRRYHEFWTFAQRATDYLMRGGSLETTFGWHLHPSRYPNPRSIVNFPIQANAAEILRIACMLATEAGIEVCMPVHDALLVNTPVANLDQTLADVKTTMARASKAVLGGFEIRVGVEIFKYPDRYMDEGRGRKMWDTVLGLLDELEASSGAQ
jgi:DNA polymerase-1